MKIALNVLVLCVLLFWSSAIMFSPMMFAGPGSTNNRGLLLFIFFLAFFPAIIFFGYQLFDLQFFTISATKLMWISLGVAVFLVSIVGLPRLILNSFKGVASEGYVKTEKLVYLDGEVIPDADPETFKEFKESYNDYSRDLDHVFYRRKVIVNADADTFGPILNDVEKNEFGGRAKNVYFWKDKNNVYVEGKVLEKADPQNFRILGTNYVISNQFVFYKDKLLEGADAASFTLLKNYIARDKFSIYQLDKKLNIKIDMSTLKFHPDSDAFLLDAKNVFLLSINEPAVVSDCDPVSFKILGRSYFKDAKNVYHYDRVSFKKVIDADAATFEVLRAYDSERAADAKDSKSYYAEGLKKQ